MGKKKLKRNRKSASITDAAWLLLEKLKVMVIAIMRSVRPTPNLAQLS